MQRLIQLRDRLDRLALACGHAVAWLSLALVLGTVTVVVLRYGFDYGNIALQEATLYLHAALFMLGMGYTLSLDEHVRVDIFYRQWSSQRRALVDLLGTLLLLMPVCIAILVLSWDYVGRAWATGEGSADAGGLPFVYVLKTLLLVMPALLLLQAAAEALRAVIRYRGGDAHSAADGEGQGWS